MKGTTQRGLPRGDPRSPITAAGTRVSEALGGASFTNAFASPGASFTDSFAQSGAAGAASPSPRAGARTARDSPPLPSPRSPTFDQVLCVCTRMYVYTRVCVCVRVPMQRLKRAANGADRPSPLDAPTTVPPLCARHFPAPGPFSTADSKSSHIIHLPSLVGFTGRFTHHTPHLSLTHRTPHPIAPLTSHILITPLTSSHPPPLPSPHITLSLASERTAGTYRGDG